MISHFSCVSSKLHNFCYRNTHYGSTAFRHHGSINAITIVLPCQRDEVSLHKKLRTEVIQLEDTLAQVRKEYEMLRIEFEQTLAANEQAGTSYQVFHSDSTLLILQNHLHKYSF